MRLENVCLTLPQGFRSPATTFDTRRCWRRVGGALGSLHVVLRAPGAAFRVFLVEGDAFGFAHESEFDVDAVEEPGRQEAGVGCTCRYGGEFGPVLSDEDG